MNTVFAYVNVEQKWIIHDEERKYWPFYIEYFKSLFWICYLKTEIKKCLDKKNQRTFALSFHCIRLYFELNYNYRLEKLYKYTLF